MRSTTTIKTRTLLSALDGTEKKKGRKKWRNKDTNESYPFPCLSEMMDTIKTVNHGFYLFSRITKGVLLDRPFFYCLFAVALVLVDESSKRVDLYCLCCVVSGVV